MNRRGSLKKCLLPRCSVLPDLDTRYILAYRDKNHGEEKAMGREQKSNKENRKQAVLTPKEKKAAKKAKKEKKGRMGE